MLLAYRKSVDVEEIEHIRLSCQLLDRTLTGRKGNQLHMSLSNFWCYGLITFPVMKIADEHVEQIQACLLRAPVILALKLCFGVREKTFQGFPVEPLSELDQEIAAGSACCVICGHLVGLISNGAFLDNMQHGRS